MYAHMSEEERTQRLLDKLRVWCDRGQDRLLEVSVILEVSPQIITRWFNRTEEPSKKQVFRVRELVEKLLDELETADLVTSAVFGSRVKLTRGDPQRGQPDVLVHLPEGKFWIEITRAPYSQKHMAEMFSMIGKKSDTESMISEISREEFSKFSVPKAFQCAINKKAKKTYSVADPVNLAVVHLGMVNDSESTIEMFRRLSRPAGFRFTKIFLIYWGRRCREREWHVMQQYPLPEQHFLATSSYLVNETEES